jgi:D-alanine-D-alanine ligase
VVDSDEKLAERVSFIHDNIGTAAIAEQYIEGRELYVGVLGNERLRVFPIWELEFGSMPQGARLIATEKVKHDLQYQQRHNIEVGPAKDLSPQLVDSIKRAAKRIYRTLDLDGYARIDFRLSADGIPYYIEANPNAEIARGEEFASAAKHDGLDYPDLIQRILALGLSRAGATEIQL